MTIKITRILGMNIQYTEGCNISDAVLHSNDGPILERIFRLVRIVSIQYGSDSKNNWVRAEAPSAAPRFSFSSEAEDEPRHASLNSEDEKRIAPLISELVTPRYTAMWFAEVVCLDGTRKTYAGGNPPARNKRARSVLGSDDARPEDFSDVCPSITAAALQAARQATRDRKILLGAMLTHLAALNDKGAFSFSVPAEITLDAGGMGKNVSIRVLKAAWCDFRDELIYRGFTVDEDSTTISW